MLKENKYHKELIILSILVFLFIVIFGLYIYTRKSNTLFKFGDTAVEENAFSANPLVERYPFVDGTGIKSYKAATQNTPATAEVWGYFDYITKDRLVLYYKDSAQRVTLYNSDDLIFLPYDLLNAPPESWTTIGGLVEGLSIPHYKGKNMKVSVEIVDGKMYAKSIEFSPHGLYQIGLEDETYFPDVAEVEESTITREAPSL